MREFSLKIEIHPPLIHKRGIPTENSDFNEKGKKLRVSSDKKWSNK